MMVASPKNHISVVVLISCTRYDTLLSTSLPSVLNQSRKPDEVYIVVDDLSVIPAQFSKIWKNDDVKIKVVLNRRTKNLSGALNTGLGEVTLDGFVPESTFLALLDDDDWWDETYLEQCFNSAIQNDCDWVVPGIVRHEDKEHPGKYLSIPQYLSESQFLSRNPHIQGSNLFVRLSSLLLAGGFDEYLPSTTDRDVCIRLLRLGKIRYTVLKSHPVHHSAFGKNRLSEFGSDRKCEGLKRFFEKYRGVMTDSERTSHLKRSLELFGCEIDNSYQSNENNHNLEIENTEEIKQAPDFNLIIGAIVSSLENSYKLVQGISALQKQTNRISALVLEDNFGDEEHFTKLSEGLEKEGIRLRVITKEEAEDVAESGDLGNYYRDSERRSGIPYGRTVLHRFVYLESLNYREPVVWIVDDDISLSNLYWGTLERRIDGKELLKHIESWRRDEVSIVVGKVGGDPPLPVMSTMRTQLLDLHFNLLSFGKNSVKTSKEMRNEDWKRFAERFIDYHYDFPTFSYGHLEFPTWLPESLYTDDKNFILHKMAELSPKIMNSNVFRPASYSTKPQEKQYDWNGSEFGPVRGGNTIILDMDCLKTFFNGSPHTYGLPYRRGDTLWVTLNRRLGSRKPDRKSNVIITSPLMLIQKRETIETLEHMKSKLISDSLGSAFTKTLDRFLTQKILARSQNVPDFYSPLKFSDKEMEDFYSKMKEELKERTELIVLNFWRIRGLLMSIENSISNSSLLDGIEPKILAEISVSFDSLSSKLLELCNSDSIEGLVKSILNFNKDDLLDFLKSLYDSNRQFSANLPIRYSDKSLTSTLKSIQETFHTSSLSLIGQGKEGIVFADETSCYKYFHYGRCDVGNAQINFLKEKILGKEFQHIAELLDVREVGNSLILKEEYVRGEVYHGGLLLDLIELTRECRESGIIIKNIAPKNLIVSQGHVKFIDIGRDITEYSAEGFERMCRRVFLTFRWHFRSDLHELLHRSIKETDFPEMFGYEWFRMSLETKTNRDIIFPKLSEKLAKLEPNNILDYGCGNGALADELSESYDVAAYDIDMGDFWKKHKGNMKLEVLDRSDLDKSQSEKELFEVVLLNLVLCSVDDEEVDSILEDVKNLVSENGAILIVICNPFSIHTTESQTCKLDEHSLSYYDNFPYEKKVKFTNGTRTDYHRPVSWYTSELKKHGFQIREISESEGVSIVELSPGSDFLFIIASPLPKCEDHDVTLMIKASPMEWRSIGFQVRHIVSQLEGPEFFREKIIVTDDACTGFARKYDDANVEKFKTELAKLKVDGVVDRVIFAPNDNTNLELLSQKWFGIRSSQKRSENGQAVLTTIHGFESSKGSYILQLDSDCIIGRKDNNHSYLESMVNTLENNEDAITVSYPILKKDTEPFGIKKVGGKWRTEVRNCLIHKSRLMKMLPLPNSINADGQLVLPWHRSLDQKLSSGSWESYRGSEGNAYFIHVPNAFKRDINAWYNEIHLVENGLVDDDQADQVDLAAVGIGETVQKRNEEMIVIVKGKDASIGKVRRCFHSLLVQDYDKFGIIAVDAGSSNGMAEYLDLIVRKEFPGRFTLFRNYDPLTSMENIYIAIRNICSNQNSIIVMLDIDDALIGQNVLNKVYHEYLEGSDLTVGTMLRTDKEATYPVDFIEPRKKRGGNVWQHLRTFRKYLFGKINVEDFKMDGKWITEAEDWAYMLPLVELSEHPALIQDVIYFYEPSNEKRIRGKKHYEDTIGRIVSKSPYIPEVKS